jgi:hypothetical protein
VSPKSRGRPKGRGKPRTPTRRPQVDASTRHPAALPAVEVEPGSAVRLTVALLWVDPPIWRRVVVPAQVSLADLHGVVQLAMGWQDSHLHEWRVGGERYGVSQPGGWGFDDDLIDERSVSLLDAAPPGSKLEYVYDFGDSWEHEVVVEAVLSPDEVGAVPRCEDGAKAGPPEDIGGVPGYYELVDALREPDSSEWATELAETFAGFDSEAFSVERVNQLFGTS